MTAILVPIPTGIFLCTLAQVKARYEIGGAGNDDKISDFIAKATERICNEYNREFIPGASRATRIVRAESHLVDLFPYDLRSAETIILHPESDEELTLVEGMDYTLGPADPLTGTYGRVKLGKLLSLQSQFSAAFDYAQLEITGDWGIWATTSDVAEDVNDAAIITVGSWISRPSAQIAGYPADLGVGQAIIPSATPSFDIPFPAHLKLARYKRGLIAVF